MAVLGSLYWCFKEILKPLIPISIQIVLHLSHFLNPEHKTQYQLRNKAENVAEKGTLAAILGKEQVRKIHKLPLSPLNPLDGPFILVPQIQRDEKTTGMGINYEKISWCRKPFCLEKQGTTGGQTWRELLKEVPGNTEKVSEKWLLTITLSVRTGQNSFRTNWREMPFPTAYSFSVNPSLQYLMNVK